MQASPQNCCEFFIHVRNFSAALPPGCAEMLCISDHRLQIYREATPRAARHSLVKISRHRGRKAEEAVKKSEIAGLVAICNAGGSPAHHATG